MIRASTTDLVRELRARFPGPLRLYVPGATGEPLALANAFRAAPELADAVTFVGTWIPGLNQTDWASFHRGARAETTFMFRTLRASFEAGQTSIRPLAYSQVTPWLERTPLDAAIVMVPPPTKDGTVSFGPSVDFSQAVLKRSRLLKLALINPDMPDPPGSPRINLSDFDLVGEDASPLIEVAQEPLPPVFEAIAAYVVSLVDDGDTLQFGLGSVQQAVLTQLKHHRDLRIHSGMISNPILPLLDGGQIEHARGAILTGIAVGTPELYDRLRHETRIAFRPATITHGQDALSRLTNFKAINSAIEVDLFGQANAEFILGRQISGTGGLVDFLRGARASTGGIGMIALASTAQAGRISRIVPCLPAGATTVTRADVSTVITEHGIARLEDTTIDERAAALIAIAAPEHRSALANSWDEMRRAM